jgi:hypothetical protein
MNTSVLRVHGLVNFAYGCLYLINLTPLCRMFKLSNHRHTVRLSVLTNCMPPFLENSSVLWKGGQVMSSLPSLTWKDIIYLVLQKHNIAGGWRAVWTPMSATWTSYIEWSILLISLSSSFLQGRLVRWAMLHVCSLDNMKLRGPTNSEDLCHVAAHVNLLFVLFLKKEQHGDNYSKAVVCLSCSSSLLH